MEPSTELAYWVGVAQTDGYDKRWVVFNKIRNKYFLRREMRLLVAKTSLPMLFKFRELSNTLFNRSIKSHQDKKSEAYYFQMSILQLSEDLEKLDIAFDDPPRPPNWCFNDPKSFGAYLAGVLDGDGNVNISRKLYPQCKIRVSSGHPQIDLKQAIQENLKCGVGILKKKERVSYIHGRKVVNKNDFCLEFKFSKKNKEFIMKHVMPFIQIEHKKQNLIEYVSLREWKSGR